MTINALGITLFLSFVISIILIAAATWIELGGNKVPKEPFDGVKPLRPWPRPNVPLKPTPSPPPKKSRGECSSCKCGSK